jgi:AraC family transcriptional regulator
MIREFDERWKQMAPVAHYDAKELAKLCRMSIRQLQRNFRSQFERAPQEWLNEQRLYAAAQLLQSGRQVKVVASELGFKQVSHFCRQFKTMNGITPSRFKGPPVRLADVANR